MMAMEFCGREYNFPTHFGEVADTCGDLNIACPSCLLAHIAKLEAHIAQLEAQADESSATMERLSGVVERYRGGMQPSSAERCALRWSHSSATDRGSFERGWEAREAEGLEAQRGGEVEVPELTEEILSLACGCAIPPSEGQDAIKFGLRSSLRSGYRNGWGDLASRIQPIPADRVLAEGMVEVDENYLSDLEETVIDVVESLERGFVVCQSCGSQEDTSTLDVMSMDLMPMKARIDALRSAKGEVEG